MGVHLGLGYDETVYLSQINGHVPAGYFSPPRARGMVFLVAPVTSWTASLAAIRLYLSALSGLALYLAFRPWQRVRPGYLAAIAAGLFSTLWTTIFYNDQAMPNLWEAYGCIAAAALVSAAWRDPANVRHRVWLFVALTWVTLCRPLDGFFVGAGLCVAVLIGRLGRRLSLVLIAPVVAAVAVGWAEWVIEAFAYFGGPISRLHGAAAENNGGINFALIAQARALAGPILCRAGCHVSAGPQYQLWWLALVVLVGFGFIATRRRHESIAFFAVPVVAGLAGVLEYTVTVNYAAPRFLLPAYGLLAVPCAEGVLWLCRPNRLGTRRIAVAGLLCLLVAHLTVQLVVARQDVYDPTHLGDAQVAGDMSRLHAAGVGRPCMILGRNSGPLDYAMGCTNTVNTEAGLMALHARGYSVAWLLPYRDRSMPFLKTWRVVRVPSLRPAIHPPWFAYLLTPSEQPRPATSR
jgi:hypothetical protein